MSEPEENYGIAEIGAMLFAFGGIATAIIQWFFGKTFWDSLSQAFMFLIAGGLLLLALTGWRTGKLGLKGGDIYRDKNPTGFWIFFAFYIIMGLGLSFVALIFLFI